MFTHSFESTLPPARFDMVPWTRVLVEFSADGGGTWTQIDDQPIDVDPTPETPDPVDITISTAPLESGLFRFRFDVEPSNPSTPSAPVLSPAPPYRPTVEQVAAVLRARTRGPASRDASVAGEQGTFTATTRPTYTQVQELIDIAVGELVGVMKGHAPCTAALETSAGSAATYRAAQLVEVGYYQEQTGDSDTTAFKALDKLWMSASKTVATAVVAQCPLVPGGDVSGLPIGRVPFYEPITWGTRW
jgi:hypothetical protein